MSTKTKKSTSTNLQEIKNLVEYMKSVGVDRFKVGEIEVHFGVQDALMSSAAPVEMTQEQREEELDRIKDRMKQISESADADLYYSAP